VEKGKAGRDGNNGKNCGKNGVAVSSKRAKAPVWKHRGQGDQRKKVRKNRRDQR